jgi:hypothetical protein
MITNAGLSAVEMARPSFIDLSLMKAYPARSTRAPKGPPLFTARHFGH